MKSPVCIILLLILSVTAGTTIQAQNLYLSLEGRFSSATIKHVTNKETLHKYYLAPAVGVRISQNLYTGALAKFYRSNYTSYNTFFPDQELENLNSSKFGVFIEKNIAISENFLLRIRSSFLYNTKETFAPDREGKSELQLSPGLIYKLGEKFYLYTNFRGIGIEDGFYFDFGFDHLNIGLQYNFLDGEE